MKASFKLAKAFLNFLNVLVSKLFACLLPLDNIWEGGMFTAD
jgi:hypothetical protein